MQDSGSPPGQNDLPAWRTCLDFESPAADHYADYVMADLFGLFAGKSNVTVRVGRMTVENVTSQEVTEFCASQFLLRCRPA